MKKDILIAILTFVCSNCFAQDWGNWIDMGHEVQVSFKFSTKGCNGYSYARIKNVSDKNKFCKVRISFSLVCNNSSNPYGSVSAYNIGPGEISQSSGNWYSAERIKDLKLTNLENKDCKDILNPKPTSGGVNEISYPGKNTGDQFQRTLDSLQKDGEKKDKEIEAKYEKEEEEKEKERLEKLKQKQEEKKEEEKRKLAALKDKLADQKDEAERKQAAEQQKNVDRMANLPSYTPTTPQQKEIAALQQKYERKAELQKTITTAIAQSAAIIHTKLADEKEERRKRSAEFEKQIDAERRGWDRQVETKYNDRLEHQITTTSLKAYSVYTSFCKVIESSKAMYNDKDLYFIMDMFFDEPDTKNINVLDYCNFLYFLTWKNGYYLNKLSAKPFLAYLTAKKNIAFSKSVENNLTDLKTEIGIIANTKFYAVGSSNKYSSPFDDQRTMVFKSLNYTYDLPLPFIYNNDSLAIKEHSQVLDVSYAAKAHAGENRKYSFPDRSGKVTASIEKVNNFSVGKFYNYLFRICACCSMKTTVEDAQSGNTEGLTDYPATVLKFNAEMIFYAPSGIIAKRNVDIYLLKDNAGNHYALSGYIEDQSENNDTSRIIHNIVNNQCNYSLGFDSQLSNYDITTNCPTFDALPKLSLFLLTDKVNVRLSYPNLTREYFNGTDKLKGTE